MAFRAKPESGSNRFEIFVEVVVLKKLCAVVLFVFLASLFVVGSAFAVVRQIPDFGNPVDPAIRGTAIDGGGMVLSADNANNQRIRDWGIHMIPLSSDFSSWISLVSKDAFTSQGIRMWATNAASNDYEFLKARVAGRYDDPTFTFNVPEGVISLLKGGDNYLTAGRPDILGYTIQSNVALQIVRHHSANPGTVHPQAYATDETDNRGAFPRNIQAGDTTVVVPYMFRADVSPAVGRTIAMPVPLDMIGNNQTDAVLGSNQGAARWNLANVSGDITRAGTLRFRGMRAQDVRLAKVHTNNLATGSTVYVRQNAASTLGLHEFVVARGNTVLAENDLLQGNERVIFKIADGTHDLTKAGDGVVVDPVIIWGDNPITKFPDVRNVPVTTHQTMGYMPATREGAGRDYNDIARVWPQVNSGAAVANNLYPDYTRQQFEIVNNLLWHTNASIAAYQGMGLLPAQVIKFPATLAGTFAGNSALVVFTLRPGAGFHGGSIGLDQLVGRPISDLRVFSLTGHADEDREYEQVFDPAQLTTANRDGTFAVLRPAQNDPNFQEVITDPEHVFAAGGVYFIAVVARDGGEFDVDQGLQGNGQGKNNECVHFSVFAAVDAATPSVTPTETPSVTPTETPSVTPSTAPSGGSSGGCSVGSFAPAAVILLAPLFLLLKK